MFKILGSNRVLFIGCLAVLSALIGYGYYNWLIPEREKSAQELQTTKAAVDQRYAEVVRMKEEYVLLQSQLREYKELEARGFFNNQDRTAAIENLDKLSKYAGLLKASLRFGSGQLINDPSAELAGQVILKSPVVVEMESIDDVDVYSFVKFVEEKFSGSVDISSFKLDRTQIYSPEILRKIGSGDPTALVKASLSFDWLTMAPKDIVAPIGDSTAGGVQ